MADDDAIADSMPGKMNVLRGLLWFACVCAVFGAACWWRDTGFANPQHDESVTLLAAKGLEREYSRLQEAGEPPFHRVVQASEWHGFTKGFKPLPYAEIWADVRAVDRHPPLAFWLFNRWLSLFPYGTYREGTWLTGLEMLLTAIILGVTVWRLTQSGSCGRGAMVLFLAGNSAVYTATWLRQYALFAFWYAVVMLLASEAARRDLSMRRFVFCAAGLALFCVAGMSTQYTFLTMSVPIHLSLAGLLGWRREWRRLTALLCAYLLAVAVFLGMHEGVLSHVTAVSGMVREHWRFDVALGDVGFMLVPVPSMVPRSVSVAVSACLLAGMLFMGARVCRRSSPVRDVTAVRVVLSGMLGAGVLQVLMVAFGLYPTWATGPNHLCAFWLLSVLAFSLLTRELAARMRRVAMGLCVLGLLGLQVVYGVNAHRLVPRVNVSYVKSERPDLVYIDDLARGMVLQLTEVMPPDQLVWVSDFGNARAQLGSQTMRQYRRILYLLMEESTFPRKSVVLKAFRDAGWIATELPVIHRNVYDAILLERD
jgi:hypothetical protein